MTYIIEEYSKVNGKWESGFHQDLKKNRNKDAMNVYVEHCTKDREKAKVFYDVDEAIRMAQFLFRKDYHHTKVISK